MMCGRKRRIAIPIRMAAINMAHPMMRSGVMRGGSMFMTGDMVLGSLPV